MREQQLDLRQQIAYLMKRPTIFNLPGEAGSFYRLIELQSQLNQLTVIEKYHHQTNSLVNMNLKPLRKNFQEFKPTLPSSNFVRTYSFTADKDSY